MEEIDYSTRCWGEVFRIYRSNGLGAVRVGDLVGIYYPLQGVWMGCGSSSCYKRSCPGNPTNTHGFSNAEKWYHCTGEVYKIYARGKRNGDIILEKDDISLYFLNGRDWVSHWDRTMHRLGQS